MELDIRVIDAVGSQQLGLITTRQWFACGGTPAGLRHAHRTRALVRVRRGVHRLAGVPPSHAQTILAACLAAGRGAVASHSSAGELWRLLACVTTDLVELTGFEGTHPDLLGVQTHRVDSLPPEHRRVHRSVPVTSPARTICDLAPRLHPDLLERTIDDAMRRKLCTWDDLDACAAWLVARGRVLLEPTLDLLQRLGREHDPGGSRSELRIVRICKEAGLELPEQQVHLDIDGHELIPDYFWLTALVVSEYDGGAHWTPSSKAKDRRKRNRYLSAGILPLEFGDGDSDASIIRELRSTLEARHRLAAAGLLPPTTARIFGTLRSVTPPTNDRYSDGIRQAGA